MVQSVNGYSRGVCFTGWTQKLIYFIWRIAVSLPQECQFHRCMKTMFECVRDYSANLIVICELIRIRNLGRQFSTLLSWNQTCLNMSWSFMLWKDGKYIFLKISSRRDTWTLMRLVRFSKVQVENLSFGIKSCNFQLSDIFLCWIALFGGQ